MVNAFLPRFRATKIGFQLTTATRNRGWGMVRVKRNSYWVFFFFKLKKKKSDFPILSLHQSYHSIWISCTNHNVWKLFSCKWCHGIRRLYTKSDINHKLGSFDECNSLWPSRSLFDWDRNLSGYEKFAFNLFVHFKLKCIFPLIYSKLTRQTTYILPRTMKTTSKVQLEHTQSLHYMNIRQFFMCLSCVPPILNSIFSKKTLLHHVSFPGKQPAFNHEF